MDRYAVELGGTTIFVPKEALETFQAEDQEQRIRELTELAQSLQSQITQPSSSKTEE